MTITGLNSNLYFAHNPIFITFNGINPSTKYIEFFESSGTLDSLKIYTNKRVSISIDISKLVKNLFPEIPHNTNYTNLNPFPVANNWVNATFIFSEVGGLSANSSITISKSFINGGIRTYDQNQNTTINTPLVPTDKIPVWGGYPVDYYYFARSGGIVESISDVMMKSNRIPHEIREIRKVKGCNPVYVKFKNSLGGYSYWLFENSEIEEKSKNLGVVERMDYPLDLGNEIDSDITLMSKVPKRFLPLIYDLSISQEIYIYRGVNKWERVINGGNNVKHNLFNVNEKVKIKIQRQLRYNPSLLW